ncbi:DUF6415 family natural product biosynthesis protein [Streptomyces sp. NPDC051909]|uniref:DUF6415 family natural product biosynthesis protein n=1 Tax=Streptomyces sp. NPDC051909 TaxID=3154944 RepID=UPI00342BC40C
MCRRCGGRPDGCWVEDAQSLSVGEVDSLTQALRGMIMIAIPEVAAAADRHLKGDIPRVCALVGLTDQYVNLGGRT